MFSNLYMRTLAPGRRQKAAKVRPDLRMKDALLIKLEPSCSCGGDDGAGEGGGEADGDAGAATQTRARGRTRGR